MKGIIARLKHNSDGTWSLPTNLTPVEGKLIECVSSMMVVKPAFDADRLCDDFIGTLKSNGLITKDEIASSGTDLRIIVQLYALAAMHNCVVQIGDGTTTQLRARPEPSIKRIQVLASVPNLFSVPNATGRFVAASIFTVELDPIIHCHPDLLANQNWDLEIELGPDKRLSPFR